MKHFRHLAPMLLLAGCQSSPAVPTEVPVTAVPAPSASVAAVPVNPEHIEASMVTVSGLPDEEVTTQQLIRQLGRPDSIAKGAVECGSRLAVPKGSPNGDFWYYGKTMYEVSGTHAILCSFNVTSGKFRGKVGKLVLNQNTTLEDVRRYFPEAAKEADKPATSRAGEEMSLPFFYNGVPMDEALILLFKGGRLQAVEFFSPC
ncbi:hypothetical protein [Hymenobacter convexus]|uniref:hypothetical protein n=1 Tax=Hymenobacter sp. CA1UV-4 TaxID=3063782 RepID=UPI002713444B|nr:hypothetical protein [Hymenobacter sp. CA1UV-4]MDO7852036.1 hypothetical protein [Hymenobacter sp. CA1UV-4]